MDNLMPEAQDIREIETGMRELLRQVSAEGLKRYLERVDKAEPLEKEKWCTTCNCDIQSAD